MRFSRKKSDILRAVNWQERISVDPKVLVGKPVVKGARIAVDLVVDLLARGWTHERILDSYPNLTAEDLRACPASASRRLPGRTLQRAGQCGLVARENRDKTGTASD